MCRAYWYLSQGTFLKILTSAALKSEIKTLCFFVLFCLFVFISLFVCPKFIPFENIYSTVIKSLSKMLCNYWSTYLFSNIFQDGNKMLLFQYYFRCFTLCAIAALVHLYSMSYLYLFLEYTLYKTSALELQNSQHRQIRKYRRLSGSWLTAHKEYKKKVPILQAFITYHHKQKLTHRHHTW